MPNLEISVDLYAKACNWRARSIRKWNQGLRTRSHLVFYRLHCAGLYKRKRGRYSFNFHHIGLQACPADPSYYVSFITLRNVINVRSIPQDCSISTKQPFPATLKSIYDSEIHTWLQLSNMSQKISHKIGNIRWELPLKRAYLDVKSPA